MLTILAAAALALPDADASFAREAAKDVPRAVLKTDVAGIWYQAFVDADGKITDCSVRGTLGDSDAADLACKAVVGRRITAARVDGKPAYGVYRGVLVLTDSGFEPEAVVFEPDVLLEVENLPSNRPVRAELVVMVGKDGDITECRPKNGRTTAYTQAACQQAGDMQLPVGKSESGEAVAYVYPLTFEFTENLASR